MKDATTFWKNVKSLLAKRNMSQNDLCKITGKGLGSFQQQVHNNRFPTVDEAIEIAKALNTTVEYLVTGENNQSTPETIKLKKIKEDIHNLLLNFDN